ncbi:MAG: LPS assembly protein LptD [Sphingomonadales bacterium]
MATTVKVIWTTAGLLLALADPAWAQAVDAGLAGTPAPKPETPAPVSAAPVVPDASGTDSANAQVDFAADSLEYQNDLDIVTASGDVRMSREGNRVRADKIVWNRKTGEVRAIGNVQVINPGGDVAYGDNVQLTDTLKDGVVENLLLVLADGGRIAARRGVQKDGISTLTTAAFSPCPVVDGDGCPRKPSWQIKAVRVIYDSGRKRVRFYGAQLDIFGVTLPLLPVMTLRTGEEGGSGFLMPDIEYTRTNGAAVTLPYYLRIAPNRDLMITPQFFSDAPPAVTGTYRALTTRGAYRIGGFATYSRSIIAGANSGTYEFRGYIDASTRYQLDPLWSISGSLRRATDRTLLRRYDISYDDRLRSTISIERIASDSYFALNGWAVQTLRAGVDQGTIPTALPEIDYRRRFDDPVLGGRVETQINMLALGRTAGQDTQRAFAGVRWDLRRLTDLGQEVIFTAYGRGDIYNSKENLLTATPLYRGLSGFQGRAIGAVAAEIRWPFIGSLWGGTQRLTPRLQFVASPSTKNLEIPNEDSRSIDLEDSNLFALNRFPGYDRWEDGPRVTYGVDWNYDAPRLSISANVGQSYRLTSQTALIPDGTGLNDRLSDIVGRTTVKFRDVVSLTHRYRLDKDGLALRRNEIDATVGDDRTYALVGYLRLNRNIGTALEDLADREEIRVGGRVQIGKYWSVFGSATVDLTDAAEDPTSLANGYQPVRHRVGIAYTDDCLDLGFTWRRDYDSSGDSQRGNSFLVRLAFRGLGR